MRSLSNRLAAVAAMITTVSLVGVRADNAPIEIAGIVSISGPYAEVGFMEARALHTAVEVTNARGGIGGHEVTLHLFDDHSDAGRAFMLADSVVRAKAAVAIVGGSVTPTCDAIRLATEPAHVVQYCLSGGQGTGDTYFSSFAAPGRLFGALPAAFMSEHRLQRVAMIIPDNHAGAVYESAMRPAVADQDLSLISVARADGADDAVAAVDHALHDKADVIYLGGSRDTEAAVLQEMRKRRSRTTVWLVDSASGSARANAFAGFLPRGPVYTAGDAMSVGAQLPSSNIQRPLLISYWKTFQHYNNGLEPNTYSAVTADAMAFITSGLRADGGVGGLKLANVIENMPTTLGLYSTYHFGPERHNGADVPGTIIRLQHDGSLKYVETLALLDATHEPAAEPAVQQEQAVPPSSPADAAASAAPATPEPIATENPSTTPVEQASPAADQAQPLPDATTAPLTEDQSSAAVPAATPLATAAPRRHRHHRHTSDDTDAVAPASVPNATSAPAATQDQTSDTQEQSAAPAASSAPVTDGDTLQETTATPAPTPVTGGTDDDDASAIRVAPQSGTGGI